VPRVIVTDKLGSYGAAKREILPGVEHRQSGYLDNRCEASHQPTRRRERHMRRFKSVRHAQHFLAIHIPVHNHFNSAVTVFRPVSIAWPAIALSFLGAMQPGLPSSADLDWLEGAALAAAVPIGRQVDNTQRS
jgi:hypothetical protein